MEKQEQIKTEQNETELTPEKMEQVNGGADYNAGTEAVLEKLKNSHGVHPVGRPSKSSGRLP